MTTRIITKTNMIAEIHNGAKTQIQDQFIIPASLKAMNNIANNDANPGRPGPILMFIFLSFVSLIAIYNNDRTMSRVL